MDGGTVTGLSDRDRHLVNTATATRYTAIAADLRRLADAAEREAGRVGEHPVRTRTATALEFVRAVHNAIPNLSLTALVSYAAEADETEAELLTEATETAPANGSPDEDDR